MNLNQREHCLGLSYIAVSRVKTLDSVLFEVPFDFEHFTFKDSAVSQERELDYTFRNTQLYCVEGRTNWGAIVLN